MNAPLLPLILCGAAWATVLVLLALIVRSDVRYRLIPNELVGGIVGVWAVMHLGLFVFGSPYGVVAEAQALGMPDWLALRLAPVHFVEGLVTALVATVVLFVIGALYERIRGRQAMGAGDVKLIGALALFLGPARLVVCLIAACVFALAASLISRSRTFPFAPALALAFVCAIFIEL